MEERVKKSLKYSIADGSSHAAMLGFGDQYINAFAVLFKPSSTQFGLLTSIPLLISSIMQLVSIEVIDKFKWRKKVIVGASLLQALVWIPMFALPFFFREFSMQFLILFVTLYTVCNSFISPAWNSMMGDLVPAEERGSYFGNRNKITGFITFASLIAGGLILSHFKDINVWIGFGILFGLAMFGRLASTFFLSRMYEPKYSVSKEHYFSVLDFFRRAPKSNFAQFVFYVAIMNFAVQIAGPFFTLFWLRDLKYGYIIFMVLTAASAITSFLTNRYWGLFADKFGNKKIIVITGMLVPIVPIMWLWSGALHSIPYILLCQVFSGFVWAGFNLCAANFIFDAVTPQKRARCVAYYNFFNGAFQFAGATIGGILAFFLPKWIFISNLQVLMLISGSLRLLASMVFLPRFKEVRPVEEIPTEKLFWQIVAIKPTQGLVYELISGVNKVNIFKRKKP